MAELFTEKEYFDIMRLAGKASDIFEQRAVASAYARIIIQQTIDFIKNAQEGCAQYPGRSSEDEALSPELRTYLVLTAAYHPAASYEPDHFNTFIQPLESVLSARQEETEKISAPNMLEYMIQTFNNPKVQAARRAYKEFLDIREELVEACKGLRDYAQEQYARLVGMPEKPPKKPDLQNTGA